MKLLLTSAGVKNPSIHAALLDLLGKPISEAKALAIPTAVFAKPDGVFHSYRFITGTSTQMCGLGWESVGMLELSALPTIPQERWLPAVEAADVFLVDGGDALYLTHWMRESGLADMLPGFVDKVWVGLSAGSMVMTPQIGEEFLDWTPPDGIDRALRLVDFAIFPHLANPMLPENTLANAEIWAAALPCPCYAIDDETAIVVDGGETRVVSEGEWHRFEA